jgi:hypothetical protein
MTVALVIICGRFLTRHVLENFRLDRWCPGIPVTFTSLERALSKIYDRLRK